MSTEHLTSLPDEFLAYPTNRLVCVFQNEGTFRAAMTQFAEAGFDVEDIYVLHGSEGLRALDVDGTRHGVLAQISRAVHHVFSDTEAHEFALLEEHLEAGNIAIAVHVPKPNDREKAHQIMHDNSGHHIVYFARFYIEDVEE